jgi:hypothetical protein
MSPARKTTVSPARRTAPQLEIEIETVTPTLAQIYLDRMDNPRAPIRNAVNRYAADMAEGNWYVGTSSLKFDTNGVLRDGQNRLLGCIAAGKPFTTVVFRGVTDDAVANVDRGSMRTWAQLLRARGVPCALNVQSSVALAWRWDHGHVAGEGKRVHPSITQGEVWLHEHPEIHGCVRAAESVRGNVGGNSSALAAFRYRTDIIDAGAAATFFEALTTGANLDVTDPIKRLRDRLMSDRARSGHRSGGLVQVVELAVLIKTWNAWLAGKPMAQLAWKRFDMFPALTDATGQPWPFPEVVAAQEQAAQEAKAQRASKKTKPRTKP